MQLEGLVKKISQRSFTRRGGKTGTVYSFQLEPDKDDAVWVTFGFDKVPPFEEGDRIVVEAKEDNNGYLVYVEGTGRIIPARTESVRTGSKEGTGERSGNSQTAPTATSQTAKQTAESNRQGQIVWQHSQEMAIAKVGLLLQHDGLPMSVAKTKAGQAQRYEEISAMIDKETVKAYNDVVTGRVLEHVADIGVVDTSAPDQIPPADTKKTQQQSNRGDDDIG